MSSPTEPPIPKRRGRRRKDEAPSDVVLPDASPIKVASKRGRKAKSVVGTYTTDILPCGSMSDDENVIVQLNIKAPIDGTKTEIVIPSVVLPKAYDTHSSNSFSSTPMEVVHQPAKDKLSKAWSTTKVVELLKDFEMKSKASEWPLTTNIACYWCCHKFNSVPFGIPVKFYHGKFHVYGCFCSLECAAAYNFNYGDSLDEVWERYNLINLLSRKLGHVNKVKNSPNRLALKMFGGHMEIDEFRKFVESNKVLNVNFPPMTTLTQQVEELNECDINSEYRYIPIDNERINKYKEKLTLRRTKPVTDFKNTLDHMMNLKIQA